MRGRQGAMQAAARLSHGQSALLGLPFSPGIFGLELLRVAQRQHGRWVGLGNDRLLERGVRVAPSPSLLRLLGELCCLSHSLCFLIKFDSAPRLPQQRGHHHRGASRKRGEREQRLLEVRVEFS